MADPYSIVRVQGKKLDALTWSALKELERRLGYKRGSLTIVQGSYNTSVGASAGTHAGGGAVDLSANDHARKVKHARAIGFAAWYRPRIPGLWGAHVHMILIGNKKLSRQARAQVVAYKNHRNGLASNKFDPVPHPKPQPIWHMK